MSEPLTQMVPEVDSDQRMHVLDESCWCGPDIVEVTTFADLEPVEELVHHRWVDVI